MFKITAFLLFVVSVAYGEIKPDSSWMNQKFSMFIHWGLYSELGGVWNGKPVTNGYSEQIQSHGGIFSDWYADVARRFMPQSWNADSIVLLAKAAGMKSIVFTSKHHDGFCMYHSAYTDYNIVDATRFKRDVMKELAEACRRHGIRFGVYYSLIDWHFPGAYPISSHNADPLTAEHYAYNLKQVEEIMKGYGAISEIWFDMGSLTPEQSRGLYDLVNRLQPGCMISGRLGNDCTDFSVMADNEYPDYKIGVPWQTAASFFDETWGYRSWQERGKVEDKVKEKILSLVKVVSRGGNYLLNIGPDGKGRVVPFEREVLLEMGKWLRTYGEGIYGAQANPFDLSFPWGDVTCKGRKFYLFIEKGKVPEQIRLDGLRGRIREAGYWDGEKIGVDQVGGEWVLYLSGKEHSAGPVEVMYVEMEDNYYIDPVHSRVEGNVLHPGNSVPLYAYSSMDYYTGFQSTIAYTWGVKTGKRSVTPVVYYTDQEKGKKIKLNIDGKGQELILEKGVQQKQQSAPVHWGKIYWKPSGSVFGSIPSQSLLTKEDWTEWKDFNYGDKICLPMGERRSVLLWQELESERAQDILVEIGSGNGIQVILNGEVLTIHAASRGTLYEKEVVVLPLRKGKNDLLLKLYNRFEKELCFGLYPKVEVNIYRLKGMPCLLEAKDWHRFELKLAEPVTRNAAIRLNNLRIGF